MVWHRSFFNAWNSLRNAWRQLLDQNWNKNTLQICKTHITQNLSANIFVSHFLELKKGETQSCLLFSVDCAKSQIFWNRAENQYTSEDYGTMGLKRCKYRPLISSILVVCLMDSKTCKIKYFEDIGFNNSLATMHIYIYRWPTNYLYIYMYIYIYIYIQLGFCSTWWTWQLDLKTKGRKTSIQTKIRRAEAYIWMDWFSIPQVQQGPGKVFSLFYCPAFYGHVLVQRMEQSFMQPSEQCKLTVFSYSEGLWNRKW